MHSIAKKAGLTAGLLHYHFKSKQEILLALAEHLHQKIQKRYQHSLSSESDAFTRLRTFIDAHLALGDGADAEAVACWIVIASEAVREDSVRSAYQTIVGEQMRLLESILDECLAQKGKTTARKRALTLGTYAAIEGCYNMLVAAPQLIEKGFAAPTVLSMTMGAIAQE